MPKTMAYAPYGSARSEPAITSAVMLEQAIANSRAARRTLPRATSRLQVSSARFAFDGVAHGVRGAPIGRMRKIAAS